MEYKSDTINSDISNTIKIATLIAILMVVFLHADNEVAHSISISMNNTDKISTYLINYISNGITRTAVPLFFLISGYLFYNSITNNFEWYKIQFQKRFKSLVIPYLLWSILVLLIYFIIQIPHFTHQFFNKDLISEYSFVKLLDTIFIHPLPYQLWFIRDLILLVLLTPLIIFLLKKIKLILPVILFILWLINFDYIIFQGGSIVFFVAGIYLRYINPNLLIMKKWDILLLIFWLFSLLLETYLKLNYHISFIDLIHKIDIILGITAIWNFSFRINSNIILNLSKYTIAIYLFHEPILTIIKKILIKTSNHLPYAQLTIYLIAPIIAIILSLIIAFILKKYFNKFYNLLTGNR